MWGYTAVDKAYSTAGKEKNAVEIKKKQQIGITALYCRLSRDDRTDNDTLSWDIYRKML